MWVPVLRHFIPLAGRSAIGSAVRWSVCVAVLLPQVGCGKRDESLAEVRGDVTLCGLPVIAEILFEPFPEPGKSSGRPSTAVTDAQGRFRMMQEPSVPGARIGRHRVSVRVQRLVADDQPLQLPETPEGISGHLKGTQLSREVRSGHNEFHFRLTP
jgi:hypothetical protein